MRQPDEEYMRAAMRAAASSTDRSTKVGAVVVDPSGQIVSVAFNAFPPGVEHATERHERPEKYLWTEHAERAAIYRAARDGVALAGCSMFLPWFPCMDCARAIALVGIVDLVAVEPSEADKAGRWAADFQRVPVLLREAGVRLRFVPLPSA